MNTDPKPTPHSVEATPTPRRGRGTLWLAVAMAAGMLAVVSYAVAPHVSGYTFTAEFVSATGIYRGDDVRVMGVTVGRIEAIEPIGDKVRARLRVDSGQPIPADAKAVIMSPNLVSSRFIQLAPTYTGGPQLASGATIPVSRTGGTRGMGSGQNPTAAPGHRLGA